MGDYECVCKNNKQKVKILWHLIQALKHIVIFFLCQKDKKGKEKIKYPLCLHLKLTLWSEISF